MSSVQSSARIFRSMIHKRFVVERWPGQDDLCASTRNMLFVAVCCNTPALCYADIIDNGITPQHFSFSQQNFTTDPSHCILDDLNPSEGHLVTLTNFTNDRHQRRRKALAPVPVDGGVKVRPRAHEDGGPLNVNDCQWVSTGVS